MTITAPTPAASASWASLESLTAHMEEVAGIPPQVMWGTLVGSVELQEPNVPAATAGWSSPSLPVNPIAKATWQANDPGNPVAVAAWAALGPHRVTSEATFAGAQWSARPDQLAAIQAVITETDGTEQVLVENTVYEATIASSVVQSYETIVQFAGLTPDADGRVFVDGVIWYITLDGNGDVDFFLEITEPEGIPTYDPADNPIPTEFRRGRGGEYGSIGV